LWRVSRYAESLEWRRIRRCAAAPSADVGGTFAPSSSPCGHDRHEQRWGRAAAPEPTLAVRGGLRSAFMRPST